LNKTKTELHFTREQEKKIFLFLENCFRQKIAGRKSAGQGSWRLGKTLNYDKVYLTVIRDGHIYCCQSGKADPKAKNRLRRDLEIAVHDCLADDRFGKKITPQEISHCHLVLEFFYNKTPLKKSPAAELQHQIVTGLNALEIINRDKRAYYKSAVMIEKNLELPDTLIKLRKKAHLPQDALKNPATRLYKFDTVSFLKTPQGKIIDLFRCNPYPFPEPEKINRREVITHLKLGTQWIKNNLNPKTGLPEYVYFPSKKSYAHHPNQLRILGLSWGATLMSEFLRMPQLKSISKTIVQKYLAQYKKSGKSGCYLLIDGQAKISYNAFLILSLLELKNYPGRLVLLKKLAEAILSRQLPDGSFYTDFEKNTRHKSDFYPGEVMLALIILNRHYPNPRYLAAVQQAFPYYRNYWRNNRTTAFIPWHTQVYYQLYLETKNPQLPKFIFEINDWLAKKQITGHTQPDQFGAFLPKPSINTSSYLEGLADAWKMASIIKDKKHMEQYLRAVRQATAFILRTQYTRENSFYLTDPEKAVGGFRKSLTKNIERCDFVQHACVALIKTLKYGIFR